MDKRTMTNLVLIIVLAALAAYLVLPVSRPAWLADYGLFWRQKEMRNFDFQLGLDLRGGLQVLLTADVEAQAVTPETMEMARDIIENRINALGLTEPVVQIQGADRIVVEIPGIEDPQQAIDTIRETSLLEFVAPPTGVTARPGDVVSTTYGLDPSLPVSSTFFTTVLDGGDLTSAYATSEPQTGVAVVAIELTSSGARIFADYTANHMYQNLCMVLDKVVLSCPQIEAVISDGNAIIRGNFTRQSAQQLALQLQYGALPIPLRIESYKSIGPSLGSISVEKSIRAGVVGLAIVFLFMLAFYRLNGLAADLALALYVLLNLLIYKLFPVTLTLPGIAGFLLSVGMAVDANILVFERMKEELRQGRSLARAAEVGFSRAWTSVRDSNIATLLTCAILFGFGSAFAASLVKGFAITLALGTTINLFTAIVVTRNLIRGLFGLTGEWLKTKPWLLGLRRSND